GLDRVHYERLLGSFSHRSFRAAPALCLAAFDGIASVGLRRFCAEYDPYHDVPLVMTEARPAIRLAASCARSRSLLHATGPASP
ncbi:MAG TPA: hypothetical protein VFE12_02195, partial [Acetobacteraceae bacterium]|nr:hypothetical protein [Acetobacteraceae bacterium]